MEPEVTAALISLCGVIISVLVTLLINVGQSKYNYNQLFAQTVSSTREKWLCIFRENLSKCLACAEILNQWEDGQHKGDELKKVEYEKEFFESRGMLVSRLNMNEKLHMLFFAAISQIDYAKPCVEFVAKREYVYEVARSLMKEEWECVKKEARGKIRK